MSKWYGRNDRARHFEHYTERIISNHCKKNKCTNVKPIQNNMASIQCHNVREMYGSIHKEL